ncbi:MAG: hypothetical protein ACEY3E_04345 [Candidatus Tisiphia sp.]
MRKILIILILQFIVIEAFTSIGRIKLHSFDNLYEFDIRIINSYIELA